MLGCPYQYFAFKIISFTLIYARDIATLQLIREKRDTMSSKPILIVESPSKAKTISKYLGGEYEVMASVGHIKDLPKKELGWIFKL